MTITIDTTTPRTRWSKYALGRMSFEDRLDVQTAPCPLTGCWFWYGELDQKGYGRTCNNGKFVSAHRASYMRHVGPIPDGMQLDHLCRQPSCVNPGHLEPVSLRENVLRGVGISAQNRRLTHCRRGHEFPTQSEHGKRRPCLPCKAAAKRLARRKRADQG